MSGPMSDEQLAAIEARTNAAQPGPWPLPNQRVAPSYTKECNYDTRLPLDHEGCDVWPWSTTENMVFAYRAREDVPALIAEVRRLRAMMCAPGTARSVIGTADAS